MIPAVLVTLQVAAQILRVPPFRVIHLCETRCVKPVEDSAGRGSVRRFNRDNLFVLAVCLELQNAGIPAHHIAKCIRVFEWLLRLRALKSVVAEGGLCGALGHLGTRDMPVLLHLKVPERAASSEEPPMVFLQTGMHLPYPPESGFGFCSKSADVDIWPVRITLNLSFILSTVQLR